jgi:hypothetical protein
VLSVQPAADLRRAAWLLELAAARGWPWDVALEFSPDAVLGNAGGIVLSSDSVVLDRCTRWCNVTAEIIRRQIPQAHVLGLRLE